MSADLLRRAAALMRERAEAATAGPWVAAGNVVEGVGTVTFDKHMLSNDAEHIASWHPAVALAVADWLGRTADIEDDNHDALGWSPLDISAELAVARAYLGDES